MGGKSYRFWPEKPLKFAISAKKKLPISAKIVFLFWRSANLRRKIARIQFRNNKNLSQVRSRNKLPKNPGYVPVLYLGSVDAKKSVPPCKILQLKYCPRGFGTPAHIGRFNFICLASTTGAARIKKRGGTKFFAMIKAYANRKVFIEANWIKLLYKGSAITG